MNQKNELIFLRYKPNDFSAKEDLQVQQDMPGITAVKVLGLKESQLWRIQSDREGLFPPTNNTIHQSTGRLSKVHKETIVQCERRELNPHAFRHWILNPARLPISPLSRTPQFSKNRFLGRRLFEIHEKSIR